MCESLVRVSCISIESRTRVPKGKKGPYLVLIVEFSNKITTRTAGGFDQCGIPIRMLCRGGDRVHVRGHEYAIGRRRRSGGGDEPKLLDGLGGRHG